jgi:hypothetical protein
MRALLSSSHGGRGLSVTTTPPVCVIPLCLAFVCLPQSLRQDHRRRSDSSSHELSWDYDHLSTVSRLLVSFARAGGGSIPLWSKALFHDDATCVLSLCGWLLCACLRGCNKINDAGLMALATNCHGITAIDLR